MFQSTRRALVAALTGLALVACGSSSGETTAPGKPSGASQMTEDGIHFLGKADAPIVIQEYASVTCVHCEGFHIRVKPVLDEFIEAGLVRYDFHAFPTPPADLAVAGFAVARCAGDGEYFDVLDDLFRNRSGLIRAYQAGQAGPALGAIAKRHGFDQDAYAACLSNEEILREITEIVAEGENRGVRSTPSFFINGEPMTDGRFQSPEGARDIINAKLEELGLEPVLALVNAPETAEEPTPDAPDAPVEGDTEPDEPTAPEDDAADDSGEPATSDDTEQ